MSKPRAGAAAR